MAANPKAYTDNKGENHKFVGWATGKVDAKDYAALPVLENVEQWEDVKAGTKVYKVTPDSPIDSHQVIYAVWGDGLKINLHANNGKDTVYQTSVLEADFKDGKAVIDIPAVPYWPGGTLITDPILKQFINTKLEGTNNDPIHTFIGWASKADETGLKIGYNRSELAKEDNGLDAEQINSGKYKASTIFSYKEDTDSYESTNLLLPNNHELILEGTYDDWANRPNIHLYAHYRPFFTIDVVTNTEKLKEKMVQIQLIKIQMSLIDRM